MAIDTQQKRMSVAGAGRPSMRAVFPVATPTKAWRAGIGISYNAYTFQSVSLINNQAKRMCATGVGRPFMRGKLPVASPTESWRISSGIAYCGNALTPAAGGGFFTRRYYDEFLGAA